MRVLTLNCGSSSLKLDVIDVASDGSTERVASGSVSGLGRDGAGLGLRDGNGQSVTPIDASDHAAAFRASLSVLREHGHMADVGAIGHRVVHGGTRFRETVRIDSDVTEAIRRATALAPLHNRPALEVIEASQQAFGQDAAMAAAFDTAFFAGMPETAWRYALPRDLADRLGIRRFGFHGLAHAWMVSRYRQLRPEVREPRLVTLQLGSGCSATASVDGRAIETSMGFTPLEGLIMSTRSGDIDPALPLRLQSMTGMSAEEVEALLNEQSGLLGLSGRSGDVRDLLATERDGDAASALAIEAFCNRIRQYVGGYMALMGGCDAIVFGGGIGENSAEVRRRVCAGFEWAGLVPEAAANDAISGEDALISVPGSRVEAWVVHVDEAAVIARETAAVLR